ncbi:MAG TPA: ABC transporter ATP-binding protein [Gemmataceae bacterium]|nr:ABC transporter ATP-binding protein [Gemmataceae bacterium]
MSQALLEVCDVRKNYGRIEALRGVTFQVEENELFGLLGPNGAGKTTLISILSCLLAPSAGEARLSGQPIRLHDLNSRKQIGVVPQDLAIYGELTARENLAFFGRLYGLQGAELNHRVEAVLETIALADRARDRVNTFSGGMKRRLNLGVSILHRPKLLLLDEPTTGVDPQSRNRIFEEVRRLNREGMTIVYTSHYMEEVQALCSRIGILDGGKLIACDTLPNLLRLLEGRIRVRLPQVPAALRQRIQQLPNVQVAEPQPNVLELSCKEAARAMFALVPLLQEHKLEPLELETQEPNLERVFLHLTGRALRD